MPSTACEPISEEVIFDKKDQLQKTEIALPPSRIVEALYHRKATATRLSSAG